jgi:hypothetical protein
MDCQVHDWIVYFLFILYGSIFQFSLKILGCISTLIFSICTIFWKTKCPIQSLECSSQPSTFLACLYKESHFTVTIFLLPFKVCAHFTNHHLHFPSCTHSTYDTIHITQWHLVTNMSSSMGWDSYYHSLGSISTLTKWIIIFFKK